MVCSQARELTQARRLQQDDVQIGSYRVVSIEVFERERCYMDEFAISAPLKSALQSWLALMLKGRVLLWREVPTHTVFSCCEKHLVLIHYGNMSGKSYTGRMALHLPRMHDKNVVSCFAAAVCFGDGTYDHCGVDRSRHNYWVSVFLFSRVIYT